MTTQFDLDTIIGDAERNLTNDDTGYAMSLTKSYPTDIDNLWDACTNPERTKRFIGVLEGDRRVGGVVRLMMGSDTDVATMTIETCDAPRSMTAKWSWTGEPETAIELTLSPDGDSTILTLRHKLLTRDGAAGYGAGWEDFMCRLKAVVNGTPTDAVVWDDIEGGLKATWSELADAATS